MSATRDAAGELRRDRRRAAWCRRGRPRLLRSTFSLPLVHSVIRPTIGSLVGPNSVELAVLMPAVFRAASMQAICMPKQMPKYGTPLRRANLRGLDLAGRAALAETAGHQDAVDVLEIGRRILALEDLAVDPVEVDLDPVGDAAVDQRLAQRFVGVLEAGVLADDGDVDLALGVVEAGRDLFPGREIGLRRIGDAEGGEDFAVEAFLVIGERHVVDRGDVEALDHGAFAHVAEQRELLLVATPGSAGRSAPAARPA